MKQPDLRTALVFLASRLLIGLVRIVGLLVIAATVGLAVRLFILAAGL